MLCGGFAEDLAAASAAANLSKKNSSREAQASTSTSNTTTTASKDGDADVVDLQFDDPNISRAAFEYSIARLYGDGPKLVLPSGRHLLRHIPFPLHLPCACLNHPICSSLIS